MLDRIKQKPEEYKRKFAFMTALSFSVLIFSGWVYSKGFLDYGAPVVAQQTIEKSVEKVPAKSQTAATSNSSDYSPLNSTKNSMNSLWQEIGVQFSLLKESVSSVIVPFITGINIYESDKTLP